MPGVTGYSIYRSTVSGFAPSAANKIGQATATTYRDTGFSVAGTYYYLVTAQDANNVSPPSNEASTVIRLDTTLANGVTDIASSGSNCNRARSVLRLRHRTT